MTKKVRSVETGYESPHIQQAGITVLLKIFQSTSVITIDFLAIFLHKTFERCGT